MLVNMLLLKKQYFCVEMKEGSSVEEHIKTTKELTDRLAAITPISKIVTLPSIYLFHFGDSSGGQRCNYLELASKLLFKRSRS